VAKNAKHHSKPMSKRTVTFLIF